MAKMLSKTEIRVLEGRVHRIITDYNGKVVQPKHKTEYDITLDDLNVRLTNYQMLLNNPQRQPKCKGDLFEIEMDILRTAASRLEYLTKPTNNTLFNAEDADDNVASEYSLKNELISLGILLVASGGLAWLLGSI